MLRPVRAPRTDEELNNKTYLWTYRFLLLYNDINWSVAAVAMVIAIIALVVAIVK